MDEEFGPKKSALNLQTPAPFNKASRPRWKHRFLRYRIGSSLANKIQTEKVSLFLYSVGDVADYIMTTINVDKDTVKACEGIQPLF